VTTLLTAVFGVFDRLDPFSQGLRAEYFPNTTWTAPVTAVRRDVRPSTTSFWLDGLLPEFSVRWTGALVVFTPGTYTLATRSDDGSSVFVDGRPIVDNSGRHGEQLATGTMTLSRGLHDLRVSYFQDGGEARMELLWARDGAPLTPVPSWALRERRASTLARVVPSIALSVTFRAVQLLWVALLVVSVLAVIFTRMKRALERVDLWRAMRWILAGSLALDVAGLWWGLPGVWVAIETMPSEVLYGWAMRFSNGWFEAYPPLQYYLLALASGPLMLAQSLGWVNLLTSTGLTLLIVIYRCVSVILAAATVAATALVAVRVWNRRAALFAAATVSLMVPFVYYAKTANVDVPYLSFFAMSLVFYVRLLQEGRLRDYVWFAVCATASICTKDQAYALYVTVPFVAVWELWRVNHDAGIAHPLWRAIVDRRLWAAAATAVLFYALCCNFLFNMSGFLAHVKSIVDAAGAYRLYEPTWDGRWQLLVVTIKLVVISMGWPLFVVALAGVVIGGLSPRARRATVWLTLMIPAYYFAVINVVLYNYDRFMMPVCLVFAVFAGVAVDAFVSSGTAMRRWAWVPVAGVFAYSILYAAVVDVLMIGDSRYAAQDWMRAHIASSDTVAVTELHEYLPTRDNYLDIRTADDLERYRPDFFVLNADYANSAPPGSEWARLIAGVKSGQLGYQRVERFRSPSPWPWLPAMHPDLVGPRLEALGFTTVRNINPTIEIFARERHAPPTGVNP
jgi:hypothetical protein